MMIYNSINTRQVQSNIFDQFSSEISQKYLKIVVIALAIITAVATAFYVYNRYLNKIEKPLHHVEKPPAPLPNPVQLAKPISQAASPLPYDPPKPPPAAAEISQKINCRIELKDDFETMIRDHHAARYRTMKLKQDLHELEEQLTAARKIANSLETYKQKVQSDLDDATKIVAFEKICSHPLQLAAPKTDEAQFAEEPFKHVKGLSLAAGVIIRLPDGRIVLREPAGAFAGYYYALPKGRLDKNETPQQAAIREAKEESGLDVRLTGVLGDYKGDTTLTRYYTAELVGGDPSQCDWETDRVLFVPLDQVDALLDQNINPKSCLKQVFEDLRKLNKS